MDDMSVRTATWPSGERDSGCIEILLQEGGSVWLKTSSDERQQLQQETSHHCQCQALRESHTHTYNNINSNYTPITSSQFQFHLKNTNSISK